MKVTLVYSAVASLLLKAGFASRKSENPVVVEMSSHSFESPLTIGMDTTCFPSTLFGRYGPQQLEIIRLNDRS